VGKGALHNARYGSAAARAVPTIGGLANQRWGRFALPTLQVPRYAPPGTTTERASDARLPSLSPTPRP